MSPLGIMAEKGTIRLNGRVVPPLTDIFPGDQVRTGPNSIAVLRLRWGATVTLASKSRLTLSANIRLRRLRLAQGALILRSTGARPTQIDVGNERIAAGGGKGLPALCRVAMIGDNPAVFAQSGNIEVRGADRVWKLPLGQWVRMQASDGPMPADPQTAGSVTNEIPTALRQPAGQTTQLPLSVTQSVDWNDLVRTLRTGRVRIGLLDGSVLNIGARSVMRIVDQHPRAQQTDIELTLGVMRAKVVKLTQPNAHFRVRTQTAVIGVVGTEFIVEAGPNFTRVWCIKGVVEVWNLNTAIPGKVQLHPSQTTTVRANLPPSQPANVNVAEINREIRLTTIRGLPPPAPVTETAVNTVALGEGVASASLAGVALSRLGAASSAASQADSNASAAGSGANNALAAAGNAVNAANNSVVTTQNVLNAVSPATPASCGCQ